MAAVFNEMNIIVNDIRDAVGPELCEDLSDDDVEKFVTARNGNKQKAIEQAREYLRWYNAPIKGMGNLTPSTILDVPETEAENKMWRTHFPFAYCGHDKTGCPIYWEKAGITIANYALFKHFANEDQLVSHHIVQQEAMLKIHLKYASHHYKKNITQQICVCDMNYIKLGLDTTTLQYFIRACAIDLAYYPERLKKFYIINAPFFFRTIWAVVKPFLGPKTLAKIVIIGSDFKSQIEELIEPNQIPAYLGGKNNDFVFDSDPYHLDPPKHCDRAIPANSAK